MDWYDQSRFYSISRDWNMAQGFGDVSDEITCLRRDLNIRHVSTENSSPDNEIGIAISTYYEGPIPKIQYRLIPGEIRHIGINTIGGPMQFLWILDIKSGNPLGNPTAFRTDCNQYVLRQGLNKWWCQTFQQTSFKG